MTARRNAMHRSMFLASLAGTLGVAAAPRAASAADGVHFLTVPSESGAAAIYASERGFFRDAGLDVTVTEMQSGGAVLPAVIGGSADFGVSNPISLATAFSHGAPIACIAATVYYRASNPNSLLMVAKNSPVRKAADLNGKTIAVNGLRNTPQLSTQAWLDKDGADSKTVKFTEVPFLEMGGALVSGRVDAAFFAEPMLSQVRGELRVLGDPYGAIAPQFLTGAFFTTKAFAQAHPDVVTRVARALRGAATWANGHPQDTAAILSRVEKLDLARVMTMTRSTYAEQLRAADLQPPLDVAASYGVLGAPVDAQAMIWVDPSG
jgi:NitT/TauT family transport system substrate-binding protein